MTNAKLPPTEQIEKRAYARYLERGSEDGHALEDWLAAERELTELPEIETSEQSVSSAPRARAAIAGQESTSSTAGRAVGEHSFK
jgi:hypothetical protein